MASFLHYSSGVLGEEIAQSMAEKSVLSGNQLSHLSNRRYVDPKGFFKIIPPKGWRIQEYPQDPRGKVAFEGPIEGVVLRVLTNSVEFSDVNELQNWCETVGRQRMEYFDSKHISIERITFNDMPAIRRTHQAQGIKFFLIDILIDKVDHNLQYSAPSGKYASYVDLVMKSMETYEPVHRVLSDKEAKEHYVAKNLRMAQIAFENGDNDLALDLIKDGLKIMPRHPKLLDLQKKAVNKDSR